MKGIKIGEKLIRYIVVEKCQLASNVGSGDTDVFATPMVVNVMESVSAELLSKYLDIQSTSVGVMININHIAPTLAGTKVKFVSELINIDNRRYEFYVEAYDNAGLIAKGNHIRVVLDKERFMKKAKERSQQ